MNVSASLEWRYQLRSTLELWSDWSRDRQTVMICAANPDYSTGRVQERMAPPRNEVVIERVESK